MPEGFVQMRAWLQPAQEQSSVSIDIEVHEEPPAEPVAVLATDETDAAIDDARRFRAALAECVTGCVDDVLRDIAGDVLARELLLAPSDVAAIVAQAIERYGIEPVRVRVRREDFSIAKRCGIPCVVDDALRGGDAVIETRYGSIDASLGVRLERVLARLPM